MIERDGYVSYTHLDVYKRQGDWSRLPAAYQRILDYAWQQRLRLSGYAYEQEINEMAVSSAEEIITQITIRCDQE